jgi:hypothetical protein
MTGVFAVDRRSSARAVTGNATFTAGSERSVDDRINSEKIIGTKNERELKRIRSWSMRQCL